VSCMTRVRDEPIPVRIATEQPPFALVSCTSNLRRLAYLSR
jgi:hypothetical protein